MLPKVVFVGMEKSGLNECLQINESLQNFDWGGTLRHLKCRYTRI